MSKKDFYIGWQDDMPESNSRFLKKVIISIFVLIPILSFAVIHQQKAFTHHHFEFGITTELTGVYFEAPFPILSVESGVPDGFSKDVLLVGFGKFGAESIIENIQRKEGNLNGKKVSFKGTLIYGDGVTLLELTDEERSFVKVFDESSVETKAPQIFGETQFIGEILDPKCYFGVMKPGEGKIHKSCAIRCLSGGIPPVLRVLKDDGINYDYYLVKGKNGEKINKEVLQFVAKTISLSGTSSMQNGWKVLNIDIESIERMREELSLN